MDGEVSTYITAGMVVLMAGIAIAAFARSKNRAVWASYLVSLGIFGTFLGIVLALWGFDPDNVQSSIPDLLAGMRIAFVSSAVGVGLALILRLTHLYSTRRESAPTGRTADDIYRVLKRQTEVSKGAGEILITRLGSIESALVGDGDTTLITQFRLLRSEVGDGIRDIKSELHEFAETLAESNTKAFIEALEATIRDFNANLTQQFGENFKELNTAVGRLLEWQEQYRQTLQETLGLLQETEASMSSASSSLAAVAANATQLSEVAERQDAWLSSTLTTQGELEARLAAFEEMAASARQAIPLVQEHLNHLTSELDSSVTRTVGELQKSVKTIETAAEEVGRTQIEIAQKLPELTTSLSSKLSDTLTTLDEDLRRVASDGQRRLQQSTQELDQALGEELKKSLESLGSQLASLSNKFVQDYEPLTRELQKVVRLGRGLG